MKQVLATKGFKTSEIYSIYRRGHSATLRYIGSEEIGNKKVEVFGGVHNGGTNKGEHLFFVLMDGYYATSPILEMALEKLWNNKTNKLHGIFRYEHKRA